MPNTKNWVDFRHVRESVDFGEVLEAYGVTLKLRGEEQHHGFCPLPNHEGQRRSPSFSAHLGRRIFQCFGCQAQGNVIDFVALMERLDPDHPRDIRKAALLIQERFLHGEAQPTPKAVERDAPHAEKRRFRPQGRNRPHRRQPRGRNDRPHQVANSNPEADSENFVLEPPQKKQPDNRPRVINAPLDFELKNLDPSHPYLQKRGLTSETIQEFGLGFCSRGIMADRIAIPLHDSEGKLIGYAGRVVDDSLIDEENSKYLLPGPRVRPDKVFDFSKSLFLFNGHRFKAPLEQLIVVEGFFSVFHLHQLGWTNVVALMGSSMSEKQASLICRHTHFDSPVWIMTDGDAAGVRCAHDMLAMLAPERFVRWAALEPGQQPHTCPEERLHELLHLPVR